MSAWSYSPACVYASRAELPRFALMRSQPSFILVLVPLAHIPPQESLLSAAGTCKAVKRVGWDMLPFAMRLRFGAPSAADPQLLGWGPGAAGGPECICAPHGPCLASALQALSSTQILASAEAAPELVFAEPAPEAAAEAEALLLETLRGVGGHSADSTVRFFSKGPRQHARHSP